MKYSRIYQILGEHNPHPERRDFLFQNNATINHQFNFPDRTMIRGVSFTMRWSTIPMFKQRSLSRSKAIRTRVLPTELEEKIPKTLSHSVPTFGFQRSSSDRALASESTRSLTSAAEKVFPERPHVNGDLEDASDRSRYLSPKTKSAIGIESGGSYGSLVLDTKGIL